LNKKIQRRRWIFFVQFGKGMRAGSTTRRITCGSASSMSCNGASDEPRRYAVPL
jgi:hypothetical protein